MTLSEEEMYLMLKEDYKHRRDNEKTTTTKKIVSL